MTINTTYDLAFSFASEDRDYVELVKIECEKLGLTVYYDKDRRIDQWGKSFIQEQRKVYSGYNTKHFVPFISQNYFSKPVPTDEFKAALYVSINRSQYILPIKLDDSEIAVEYLPRDIQYLNRDQYTLEQVAGALKYIVDSNREPAKPVDKLLSDELELPTPKTMPRLYSKYEESEKLILYVSKNIEKNLQKLRSDGYVPVVRNDNEKAKIVIERDGKTIFVLNIFFSTRGENSIGFNFDTRSMFTNTHSENGNIEPFFDKESQKAGYKLDHFSFSRYNEENILTKEEITKFFWEKIVEAIEEND